MRRQVLFDDTSQFGHYKVVDMIYNDRPARLLFAGKNTPQSGLATDDQPELLFDYNQRFLELALSHQPQTVLVVGGGVMTLPRALLERTQAKRVDVVEIDPLLPRLAAQYFDTDSSDSLNIVVDDGYHYIKTTQQSYDMIVVDAFDEYDIPPNLLSDEAAKYYAARLAPGGILAINFISRYLTRRPQLSHQLQANLALVFDQTDLYPADPHYDKRAEQNLVSVAYQGQPRQFDYLQSSSVELLASAIDPSHDVA